MASGNPPRRAARVLRRLGRAPAALILIFGVLLGIGWAITPSVGDAQQRVSAELTANGGPPLQGDVPANLAAALLATEDTRFEHHPGIDPVGAARAAWGALTCPDE